MSILSPIFFGLGYISGSLAFLAMCKQRNLNPQVARNLLFAGLFGGLFLGTGIEWAVTGEGGKTIIGAVVGGYLTIALYKRHIGLARPIGDMAAVAMCVGEAVGRWGCFFGGCCYGKCTEGFVRVWQHNNWRYPTQIYSSLAAIATLAIILLLEKTRPPENTIFYAQGFLFSLSRFVIEFYREGHPFYAGLTAAQWGCTLGMAYFLVRLVINLRYWRHMNVDRPSNRIEQTHSEVLG